MGSVSSTAPLGFQRIDGFALDGRHYLVIDDQGHQYSAFFDRRTNCWFCGSFPIERAVKHYVPRP